MLLNYNLKICVMINEQHIINAQNQWGEGVVKIGSLKDNRTECETFASEFLDKHYCFGESTVLFKPTKAKPKARNPRTNEEIYVPPRRKIHYKAGKSIKLILDKDRS